VARPESIFTDDYPELCSATASFSCAPAEPNAQPHSAPDGTLVRNGVEMTATFAQGAAGFERFARMVAKRGAMLSFDIDLLASHDDFAEGTGCGVQIPYSGAACEAAGRCAF
jgi:hypothetical protein